MSGEKRNCMKAYAPITQPKYLEAWLIGTAAVSEINVGKEGMMIPKPMESKQIVTNIKSKADFGLMTFIGELDLVWGTKIENS